MINALIKRLILQINCFIYDNDKSFNTNFTLRVVVNIEDKCLFKRGYCSAVTAQNTQCSRKILAGKHLCGLHCSDDHAHRRKKTRTTRFLTNKDNISQFKYSIKFDKQTYIPSLHNLLKFSDEFHNYLLDTSTYILYKNVGSHIIEMGDYHSYNLNISY